MGRCNFKAETAGCLVWHFVTVQGFSGRAGMVMAVFYEAVLHSLTICRLPNRVGVVDTDLRRESGGSHGVQS